MCGANTFLIGAARLKSGTDERFSTCAACRPISSETANADAPEWADLVAQFLALTGAWATPDHVPAVGLDDQAHHLVQQNLPILTSVDHVDVPGGVIRPIVDPVPVYPWSMAWRPGAHPLGLTAVREAAASIGGAVGSTALPPESDWGFS